MTWSLAIVGLGGVVVWLLAGNIREPQPETQDERDETDLLTGVYGDEDDLGF